MHPFILTELVENRALLRMKFSPLYILIFIVLSTSTRAQDVEVGLAGGVVYYLGDLNPGTHFKNSQIAYGLLARYNINERWAVRLSGMRGKLEGSSLESEYMPSRNLAFESPVTDISLVAEFNFFPYFTGSRRTGITPYIYTGAGVTFFNPTAGGQELRGLGTEGQNVGYEGRKPYHLTQFNFPFGLGGKFSLNKRLCITAFWEMHLLFFDYLDDVSTTYYLEGSLINPDDPAQYLSDPAMTHQPGMKRGNSSAMDWYSFSGITLTYKFALGSSRRCRDLKGQ